MGLPRIMLYTLNNQFTQGYQSMSNEHPIELHNHIFYGRDLEQPER